MDRRRTLAFGMACALALAALFGFARPALAGGWAVVTLDALPVDVRAGQPVTLGFMVRQHGRTPIDVHTFEGRMPVLRARHAASGATLAAEARKEGPVGHYAVTVTFPRDGVWSWSIAPEPFAATNLGELTVLPAAPAAPSPPASAAAPSPVLARAAQIAGGLLLAVALALAVAGVARRRTPTPHPAESAP
jgi:hypothetical protein